ncbi:MAG: MarR family transcriptional regulator [Saprospiraceae bacterium]|nr:MarR family transcriptional regulator [Lewinella sp.]
MKAIHVESIRSFNRFYTRIIGLLDEYILDSPYTLPEARILFEINRHRQITALDIINELKIDKGYLSRILRKFERQTLIRKERSAQDGRSAYLILTEHGQQVFQDLNQRSQEQIRNIFSGLDEEDQALLIDRMQDVQKIISSYGITPS